MENALTDMETLAKALNIEPFDVYILGGAGCVLARYFDRATRDFDIVDLDYSASLGRVMKPLEPFDLIDLQLATIPPGYKARATRLPQFKYLSIYVLSREDIIVSKLARFNERDSDDIKKLLAGADISLVFGLSEKVLGSDYAPKLKHSLVENLARCLDDCGVSDSVQQFEELRKRV